MNYTSKMAFTGLVALACVSAVSVPVAAQEDEGAEAVRELQELRRQAKTAFTPEVEACIDRELPEARELIEAVQRLTESPGATFETQFLAPQLSIELAQGCEELSESRRYYPEEFERIKKRHGLEVHSQLLALRSRQSRDEAEKRRLEVELQHSLEASFAMIQEAIEQEAQEAGAEFEHAQRRAEDRTKYRKEIIQRRMHELLYDEDLFDWW